jgi:signal transduction histidine kinase
MKDAILDEDLNTAFFRIFQETLTNVIRHAHATKVAVHLKKSRGQLLLEVKDNGRGISEAEITNTKSIGLLGMRERAALLGGKVIVTGSAGHGTTVLVKIPLHHRQTNNNGKHESSHRRRSRRGSPRLAANSRRRI